MHVEFPFLQGGAYALRTARRQAVGVLPALAWITIAVVAWLLSKDYSPEHADEDVEAIEWAARKVANFGKSTIKFLGRST